MRYFGVPKCPYCKKRVNLIRTWSLKKQGEYQCPRCNGISNIYLSPLIYVLGLLAIFTSGVLYFFHKFVLDDVTLETALYVFLPFAAFFLFSLFMVYLEKPVIKKISREEYEKRHRFRGGKEEAAPAPAQRPEYFDDEDHIPRASQRTGPIPQPNPGDSGVVNQQAFQRARVQAEKDNLQISQRIHVPQPAKPQYQPQPQRPAQPVRPVVHQTPQRPSASAVNSRQPGYAQQPRQGMSFAQQGAAMQHGERPGYLPPRRGMEAPVNRGGTTDNQAYLQQRLSQIDRNGPNSRQP